jgi:predicted nucleic acid-binding protein
MSAVFVDTGGWMACADVADPAHRPSTAARDEALEAGRILVTTDFVVDETLTLVRFRLGLAAATKWW